MTERTHDKRADRKRRGCCLGGCLLWALSLLAAAQVAAVLILRQHPGEDRWETATLIYAPQLVFVALPVLASLWALLARRGGMLLANLMVLGVALFAIADLQLPGPRPKQDGGQTIRVLTWNVRGRVLRMEEIRAAILEWDPDIVCVQETYYRGFQELLPGYEHRRASDVRIFSRLEVLRSERVPMGEALPRKALVCEVSTDAGPLTLIGLHFPRSIERSPAPRDLTSLQAQVRDGMKARRGKFDDLLNWLPEDRPVIVLGDLNTPPASRYYRQLSERLTDAFAARGSGFGYTWLWRSRWPLLRIDYVWCGGGVRPLTCLTGPHTPSDHRMLVADVLIPAE